MKIKPVISFLVPSFNHDKYILELLESIKKEVLSLSVLSEVIIIDDCSSDNSKNIISKWEEENSSIFPIIFLSSDVNKGIAATFNDLIAISNGEYCRFCGSDDVIINGGTQKLLNEFAKSEKILCCFCDGVVIDDMDKVISDSSIDFHGGNVDRLSSQEYMASELIQNWCLAGPSFLVKKKFYECMRYDESLKIEDYDFYLTLLEIEGALSFVNEKLCYYRVHNKNTSKTKNKSKRIENLNSFLSIVNRHLEKKALNKYLLPVKYKTEAKINFLEKKYYHAVFFLCKYFFAK